MLVLVGLIGVGWLVFIMTSGQESVPEVVETQPPARFVPADFPEPTTSPSDMPPPTSPPPGQ